MSAIFYPDIQEKLQKYTCEGSKYGLSRTRALLSAFSDPDKQLKIVHIAGSNGKGSIAAYITNILIASGAKVGTFTSPEVFSYSEKFLFNGKPADEVINYYLSEVYDAASAMSDRPTAFEIETVAALTAFRAAGCEYAVVECGLGGRDDATNAISQKAVAVISSISLEHTAVLGDTIESICAHKAGIIKNCPVVVSALQCEEGRAYFSQFTDKFAGDGLEILSRDRGGQFFLYGGVRYFIKMHGDAQCYNAATAIEAAKILGIDSCTISAGLVLTRLTGRCDIRESGGRTYILDGAHNPAAFSPLSDMLKSTDGEKSLVFGCLSDKDVRSSAEILCPLFDEIIIFSPSSYRAMDRDKIFSAFEAAGAKRIRAAQGIEDALGMAEGKIIAVCGSFTFLKEALQWIEKRQ